MLADGTRALFTDGDLQASRAGFERAYLLAEDAGDIRAMAVAVLGLGGLWLHEHRTVTGAVLLESRLRHTLSLLDPQSSLALRIRARLAGEADYLRGESAAVLAVLGQARATGDPVALAETLSLAHHCLLGPDHIPLRRELSVELIRESFRTGRRSDLMMGLVWQTIDCFHQGDPHAGRLLAELRAQLAQRNHLAVEFVVRAMEVMLAIRGGRLDEAETLAGVCARTGTAAGGVDVAGWYGAQLVTIRWYQGRLGELLPMLKDLVGSLELSAVDNSSLGALAVAAALDGDRRTATGSLAALCGHDLADLPRSSSWLVTMNAVVEAAHLLGDADIAARAHELLLPYAQLPMVGSLGVACFGGTRHALGVAALTCGRSDEAVEHLRAAVRHNLALGHWPAVVVSRQRLAQALTRRALPEDAGAARRELDQAVSEAASLGIVLRGEGVAEPCQESAEESVECARVGRGWRVALGGRSVSVEHGVGMLHLAVLTANPRQEIPAAELVAGLAVLDRAGGRPVSAQPVLDHEALRNYRDRLKRLGDEIDTGEAADDPDRAARVRAERDWLAAELAGGTGLGGRARTFPDQGERARVAVGKAVRRALVRIAEADPVIGGHLRRAVHTGARCSYWPV